MTYGLTDTGFDRKPASEIRADLVTAIRQINGLQNARIGAGSVLGNLVDVFSNEISAVWEAAEAVYHALNRDAASGQSLDNLMALVGKSRDLATQSTSTLTLWTLDTGGSVSVPAGNQVEQSDTQIAWETTADATIPAAVTVLEDLDVNNINWQSANTIRYTFSGSPDLSSVVTGDLLIVTGAGTSSNNGAFAITAVDNGADWIEVTNPNRSSAAADEAGSAATASTTDGLITVAAQAIDAGAYEATAQSIDTIVTPVSNWDGVVNLADATTGRDRETDAAFRARVALELVIAQGSTLEAIKAQVRELDGVTYVAGEENRTATVDGDGNLPHSIRITVVGGTDQDIIDAIGTYKAGGIATNGSESGTYTDPEDGAHTIYFDRVTEVNIWLILNLTTTADYPADGDTLAEAAMTDYFETLEHGEDIYNWRLIGALFEADIPGITAVEILQGTSDPPAATTTISIGATQIGAAAADRITVNS
jgi:uncharacterized phage protein gp47/JayE